MIIKNEAITGGFAKPVFDAQAVFKILMDCMARPGFVHAPVVHIEPPAPLNKMAALAALTLLDTDTTYWLDASLDLEITYDWIGFHTGAIAAKEKEQAQFAILPMTADASALDGFALGSHEYPDRSATLILQVDGFSPKPQWRLTGPGIRGSQDFESLNMPAYFMEFWTNNRNRFPRGIDLIFAAPNALAALPRTTRIETVVSTQKVT